MANDTMSKNDSSNQTMQHEQAKASVSGEPNETRGNERENETGGMNKDRGEKSAIGGGQTGDTTGQTGEAGRARSELDQNKTTGQSSENDKSRSEPTSR